jgi:hypothetical protein
MLARQTNTILCAVQKLPDDDELAKVFTSLRNGSAVQASISGVKCLQLPEGVHWPRVNSNFIYERAHYEPFTRAIRTRLAPRSAVPSTTPNWAVVITGQPGIGKSAYTWYLCWDLIRSDPTRPIIYQTNLGAKERVYISVPLGVYVCHQVDLQTVARHFRCTYVAVYIADTTFPTLDICPRVVISSPGQLCNIDGEIRQSIGIDRFYFPTPTPEEVLQLKQLAFSERSDESVSKLIAQWGPIPRHVLTLALPNNQESLSQQLREVKPERLEAAVKGRTLHDIAHRVLLEHCRGEDASHGLNMDDIGYYAVGKRSFVSFAVAAYVLGRVSDGCKFDAQMLVDATVGIAAVGGYRGTLFEGIVFDMLCASRTRWEGRTLFPSPKPIATPIVVETPKLKRVIFTSLDELSVLYRHDGNTKNTLFVPTNPTFCAVDGILCKDANTNPPYFFLQTTTQVDHDLKGKGLLAVARALGWTCAAGWGPSKKQVVFVWLVSTETYDSWQREKKMAIPDEISQEAAVGTKRRVIRSPEYAAYAELERRLVQRVVKVPTTMSIILMKEYCASKCGVTIDNTLTAAAT